MSHDRSSMVCSRAIRQGLVNDAKQDFEIRQHKRYIHPPALAEGDGPIGKFRIWARLFYHELVGQIAGSASLVPAQAVTADASYQQ